MFEKVKEYCDLFLQFDIPGFDVVVYHDGKCVLRYMNGYSDIENKIKMNGSERYNIYSCTKLFTCVAALQLWEKGLFRLDDKLSDYMPEYENMTVCVNEDIDPLRTGTGGEDGRRYDPIVGKYVRPAKTHIKIKDLFQMTAGFSYNNATPHLLECGKDTEGRYPTRETMKYLAKEPLLFDPGKIWNYSLCHDVLAALVEVLSGEKFEDYVKKHIFDPCGMTRSTLMLPEEELDTIAEQYIYKDAKAVNIGKKIWKYKFGSEYASGGAGGISTVDDYIKFLEALRTGKLLKLSTVDLMRHTVVTDEQVEGFAVKYGRNHYYALGVRVGINRAYNDFGWGGAACAYAAIDPERKLSMYFGTHMLSSPIAGMRGMLYRLVKAEMFDHSDFDEIAVMSKRLYGYDLPY